MSDNTHPYPADWGVPRFGTSYFPQLAKHPRVPSLALADHCRNGDLLAAQAWRRANPDVVMGDTVMGWLLTMACEQDHLALLQWLLSIHSGPITTITRDALVTTAGVRCAQWMQEQGAVLCGKTTTCK